MKMASLRQEAELLKQQAEVEKMRKELKDLRGESLPLEESRKVHMHTQSSVILKSHHTHLSLALASQPVNQIGHETLTPGAGYSHKHWSGVCGLLLKTLKLYLSPKSAIFPLYL